MSRTIPQDLRMTLESAQEQATTLCNNATSAGAYTEASELARVLDHIEIAIKRLDNYLEESE